jgi:hypothetical protein
MREPDFCAASFVCERLRTHFSGKIGFVPPGECASAEACAALPSRISPKLASFRHVCRQHAFGPKLDSFRQTNPLRFPQSRAEPVRNSPEIGFVFDQAVGDLRGTRWPCQLLGIGLLKAKDKLASFLPEDIAVTRRPNGCLRLSSLFVRHLRPRAAAGPTLGQRPRPSRVGQAYWPASWRNSGGRRGRLPHCPVPECYSAQC